MRKKNTIIQPRYCGEDLGKIEVSTDAETHALAHQIISTFSRRSFLSVNLEGKTSPNVARSIFRNMGCISKSKVTKKKRRFLEIFKYQKDEVEETKEDEHCSLSEDINTDRILSSSEDLESHKEIHSVDKTSTLVLDIENEIFDNILSEDSAPVTEDPAELSESLLDNYEGLLESLISSVSPDDLLQKISITNEIPDDYSMRSKVTTQEKPAKSDVLFKSPNPIPSYTAPTNIVPYSNTSTGPSTPTPTPCSNISTCPLSPAPTPCSGIPTPAPIPSSMSKRRKQKPSLAEKEEDLSTVKRLKLSSEDVEYENKVNRKIFNILSKQSADLSIQQLESDTLNFSLTFPTVTDNYPAVPTTMPQLKRNSSDPRFLAKEKAVSRLYSTVREDTAVFRTVKKKKNKRGTVGYQLKMELELHQVKEEEEEIIVPDITDCSGKTSDPSSLREPSLKTTLERVTEPEPSLSEGLAKAPDCEEALLSMPVLL